MFEYSSITIFPYAAEFSISITATSGSAIGVTPFLTSGELLLLLLLAVLLPLHERESTRAAKDKQNAILFMFYLGLADFLAVQYYRHGAVIYQLNIHHCLETPGLDPTYALGR